MPVSIQFNKGQLRDAELLLRAVPRGGPRAMFSAVKKTTTTARARISRLVTAQINVPASTAKSQIALRAKPTVSKPDARISISGRLLSLHEFKPRQTKRGVAVRMFKSERTIYEKSFIAKFQELAYTRRKQKDFRLFGPASGRLPIQLLLGPSAAVAVSKDQSRLNTTISGINDVLEKNLLSQIDRLLAQPRGAR